MSTKARWLSSILNFFESSTQENVAPMAPIVFEEEFLGTTLVAGATIWLAKDTGEGAEANVADQHGGVFSLSLTATDAEQEAGLTMNDQLNFNLDKGFQIEWVVDAAVLPTLLSEAYFGVGNNYVKGRLAAADEGPTVHAMFMLDGSGAVTIHTDDASTDNDAKATGITMVAGTKYVFRIDFTTITDVKFYINGNRVASATTFDMSNGSNVVVQPYAMVYKSGGAGLGTLYLDAVRVWSVR